MGRHVHTWTSRPDALPWMRYCACGAEGHEVGGEVRELAKPRREALERLEAVLRWWGVAGCDVPGRV